MINENQEHEHGARAMRTLNPTRCLGARRAGKTTTTSSTACHSPQKGESEEGDPTQTTLNPQG